MIAHNLKDALLSSWARSFSPLARLYLPRRFDFWFVRKKRKLHCVSNLRLRFVFSCTSLAHKNGELSSFLAFVGGKALKTNREIKLQAKKSRKRVKLKLMGIEEKSIHASMSMAFASLVFPLTRILATWTENWSKWLRLGQRSPKVERFSSSWIDCLKKFQL